VKYLGQPSVVSRGHVFRDYGLLSGRLPGGRGYLFVEDFMYLWDFMGKFTREWTCDIVLRDYECLAVLLVTGGMQKNSVPGMEAEKIMRVLCSGCDRILKSGTQCDT
jgi:hypothetical protein